MFMGSESAMASDGDDLSIGRGTGNGELKDFKKNMDAWMRKRGMIHGRRPKGHIGLNEKKAEE